jgi:hypothetical protein
VRHGDKTPPENAQFGAFRSDKTSRQKGDIDICRVDTSKM